MTIGHVLCLVLGYLVGALSVWNAMRHSRRTILVALDPDATQALWQARRAMEAAADGEGDAAEELWTPNGNGRPKAVQP